MSTGMIFLTVLATLFLVVVVLPIVAGGICGSVMCLRNALKKMWAARRETARAENKYDQKPHFGYVK